MRACPCQTLDKSYQDAFEHELEMLKERVRSSAQTRMENAVKELEEEEIQKRLGPGGLDPVEVYESLPKVGHTCRHSGDNFGTAVFHANFPPPVSFLALCFRIPEFVAHSLCFSE